MREGRPDWRSVNRGIETARAAGLPGEVVAADGWSYWALSAQRPVGPAVRLLDDEPALGEAGRAVEPGERIWDFSSGAVRFPKGGGVASREAIETFSKDAFILAAEGPWADGSVTATVRLTDDLGSAHNWVGIAARRSRPADGFRESGVLGLLRGNGEAVLFWPGGEKKAATGTDPRRGPVRHGVERRARLGPRAGHGASDRRRAACGGSRQGFLDPAIGLRRSFA